MPAKKPTTTPTKPTTPAPVYALVGNDPLLQREAVSNILSNLGEDTQRSDVEGPAAEASDVFDELRSFAMFGGARAVVVREADDFVTRHRESLERFLGDLEGSSGANVLILRCTTLPKNTRVRKMIDKVGQVIECEPPKANQMPAWIASRAREQHGLKLPRDAAAMLADLLGDDLGSIDNELAKLALQSPDGPITPEMIAGGVAFRREQQMWTLTDALSTGQTGEALRIWRQLVSTDSSAEFRAVTWLAIWLEKATGALKLAKQGTNSFAIAKQLRIWPASNVDPLLRTAKALGPSGLQTATDRLAELDYRTKTGLGEAVRAVEAFIAQAGR